MNKVNHKTIRKPSFSFFAILAPLLSAKVVAVRAEERQKPASSR
jgi:hypothetical protein